MFKKLFSDSGEVSFGRVGAFIALCAAIVWVSHIVFVKDQLPDLAGITAFIVALYGVAKAGETVQKIGG